jgi:DNA-binding MarR family transcriptional regulator
LTPPSKILNISSIVPRKSKIAFIEPLLTSSMVLERHIDGCIREATPYGLTQFKILLSIQRCKKTGTKHIQGCSQSAIAQGWGVSEAAISRQIAILAKDKLITRSQNPDEMRQSIVSLTARGKSFVSKTMRMVDKELGRIFRPMSRTAKNQLASHLGKVLEALSKNTLHYEISDYNS